MVDSTIFNVFLAHNSADKPQVRAIAKELKRRKLKPWLDEEQIPPGRLFQEEIQKAIPQIQSAAICIGTKGLGKWQIIELQAIISQFIDKGSPVIPILLPGVDRIPDNLLFLQQFNWVRFEKIDDAASLYQLEWGITGIKPQSQTIVTEPPKQPASEPEKVVSPPSKQSSSNQIYKSDLVTVNAKGEEIRRESGHAEYLTENLGNDVTLDMVYIPGGTFMMGSPEGKGRDSEKPQHKVTVQAFYMGKYPITQAQYQQVMGNNPSKFKGDERPVERVSWNDAVEFCQRLSQQTGTEYRLPTEAEWEDACRAGTITKYYFGDDITSDLANYGSNVGKTTAVGKYPPNAFGLYDMHGNVWEWCQDDWHGDYENAPTDCSAWVLGQSRLKVIRGSSWYNRPEDCRSASRNFTDRRADRSYFSFGFRVVCGFGRT